MFFRSVGYTEQEAAMQPDELLYATEAMALPTPIAASGNLETLRNYLNNDPRDKNGMELGAEAITYLIRRIETIEQMNTMAADIHKNGPVKSLPKPVVSLGGDGVMLELSQPDRQVADKSCWVMPTRLMLQARGIDLSQRELLRYKPDVTPERANQISDGQARAMTQHVFNNADATFDLVSKLVPNVAMVSYQYQTSEGWSTERNQRVIDHMAKSVREAIREGNPVAILDSGHYRTIVGIDGDELIIKDSRPHEGESPDMEKRVRLDQCLSPNRNRQIQIHFLKDLTPQPNDPQLPAGLPELNGATTVKDGKLALTDPLPNGMHSVQDDFDGNHVALGRFVPTGLEPANEAGLTGIEMTIKLPLTVEPNVRVIPYGQDVPEIIEPVEEPTVDFYEQSNVNEQDSALYYPDEDQLGADLNMVNADAGELGEEPSMDELAEYAAMEVDEGEPDFDEREFARNVPGEVEIGDFSPEDVLNGSFTAEDLEGIDFDVPENDFIEPDDETVARARQNLEETISMIESEGVSMLDPLDRDRLDTSMVAPLNRSAEEITRERRVSTQPDLGDGFFGEDQNPPEQEQPAPQEEQKPNEGEVLPEDMELNEAELSALLENRNQPAAEEGEEFDLSQLNVSDDDPDGQPEEEEEGLDDEIEMLQSQIDNEGKPVEQQEQNIDEAYENLENEYNREHGLENEPKDELDEAIERMQNGEEEQDDSLDNDEDIKELREEIAAENKQLENTQPVIEQPQQENVIENNEEQPKQEEVPENNEENPQQEEVPVINEEQPQQEEVPVINEEQSRQEEVPVINEEHPQQEEPLENKEDEEPGLFQQEGDEGRNAVFEPKEERPEEIAADRNEALLNVNVENDDVEVGRPAVLEPEEEPEGIDLELNEADFSTMMESRNEAGRNEDEEPDLSQLDVSVIEPLEPIELDENKLDMSALDGRAVEMEERAMAEDRQNRSMDDIRHPAAGEEAEPQDELDEEIEQIQNGNDNQNDGPEGDEEFQELKNEIAAEEQQTEQEQPENAQEKILADFENQGSEVDISWLDDSRELDAADYERMARHEVEESFVTVAPQEQPEQKEEIPENEAENSKQEEIPDNQQENPVEEQENSAEQKEEPAVLEPEEEPEGIDLELNEADFSAMMENRNEAGRNEDEEPDLSQLDVSVIEPLEPIELDENKLDMSALDGRAVEMEERAMAEDRQNRSMDDIRHPAAEEEAEPQDELDEEIEQIQNGSDNQNDGPEGDEEFQELKNEIAAEEQQAEQEQPENAQEKILADFENQGSEVDISWLDDSRELDAADYERMARHEVEESFVTVAPQEQPEQKEEIPENEAENSKQEEVPDNQQENPEQEKEPENQEEVPEVNEEKPEQDVPENQEENPVQEQEEKSEQQEVIPENQEENPVEEQENPVEQKEEPAEKKEEPAEKKEEPAEQKEEPAPKEQKPAEKQNTKAVPPKKTVNEEPIPKVPVSPKFIPIKVEKKKSNSVHVPAAKMIPPKPAAAKTEKKVDEAQKNAEKTTEAVKTEVKAVDAPKPEQAAVANAPKAAAPMDYEKTFFRIDRNLGHKLQEMSRREEAFYQALPEGGFKTLVGEANEARQKMAEMMLKQNLTPEDNATIRRCTKIMVLARFAEIERRGGAKLGGLAKQVQEKGIEALLNSPKLETAADRAMEDYSREHLAGFLVMDGAADMAGKLTVDYMERTIGADGKRIPTPALRAVRDGIEEYHEAEHLDALSQMMKNAEKGIVGGSSEFRAMKKSLDEVIKLRNNDAKADKKLATAYLRLKENAKHYQDYRATHSAAHDKDDIRLDLAERIGEFAQMMQTTHVAKAKEAQAKVKQQKQPQKNKDELSLH